LLHFPANTNQTLHHHPSFRFGIVASGEGESVSDAGSQKLNTGDCFFIPAYVSHKFNTFGHSMNIIAFHPDSDWGPTDEVHPMKNRTIIS
jgi:mannose-6-phosphate isomerase-like protein (cupin superfamily)